MVSRNGHYRGPIRVGVDLGTAYIVLLVLDDNCEPLVGTYQFAEVVRDGLVVDFVGAIDRLRLMKDQVESRLGCRLTHAATGYPPSVAQVEIRATANVLEAAGLECTKLTDEPTAANGVLQISDGAVVDVGGGTTGIAVFRDGEKIYDADEPTGGTHFSLVIAGALDVSLEAAESLKTNPAEQSRLFPLVRPVMEKVGTIVSRHVSKYQVGTIYLVGGTALFPRIGEVVQQVTGISTIVPKDPMFVTPLGIAMTDVASWGS